MNWKKELKVGDKFLHHDLQHFAIVTQLDSKTITYAWYYINNGKEAGTPSLAVDHFYGLTFIVPTTPLLESLI
jgi:hypothetical protein